MLNLFTLILIMLAPIYIAIPTITARVFGQCQNFTDSANNTAGNTEKLLPDHKRGHGLDSKSPNFIYSEIYRCEEGSYFTKMSRIVKTYANKTDCHLYSKTRSGFKIYDVMKSDSIGTIKVHVNYTVLSYKGNETIIMTGQLSKSNFSQCEGDLFVNKQINYITGGDCRTSIVQMESSVADIQVIGNCQSYCQGKVLLM